MLGGGAVAGGGDAVVLNLLCAEKALQRARRQMRVDKAALLCQPDRLAQRSGYRIIAGHDLGRRGEQVDVAGRTQR